MVAMLVTSMLVGLLCVEVNRISWSFGFVDKYEVKHGVSEHFRVRNNVDKTYIEWAIYTTNKHDTINVMDGKCIFLRVKLLY